MKQLQKMMGLVLACFFLFAVPAFADAIYSAENPVPDIAERVRPAVVQIITKNERGGVLAYGSGVYIDERGYVVTNYHVVEGGASLDIALLDGTLLSAVGFSTDESTDLALVDLGAPLADVEPVPMGDSDALRIGELAIAIGNPGVSDSVFFGTVTCGVISGLDRSALSADNFQRSVNMIQTNAAINSGNSGGALLNARGELIGIPTLKIISGYTNSYEGLGFAIPVNLVKAVIADLIEYGAVRRPRMGVIVGDFAGVLEYDHVHAPAGVIIDSVSTDSPAEQAGLQRYDIITHVNGKRVTDYIEMSAIVDPLLAGDVLTLTVCRYYESTGLARLDGGETFDVSVTLAILE